MDKVEMLRVFGDLNQELAYDDPDMESVLYQIMTICGANGVQFSIEYDPRFGDSDDLFGPYMPELAFERFGSFDTLDEAVAATVEHFLENFRRIFSRGV